MQRYIARRLVYAFFTLWIVTVLLFLLMRVAPGDTIDELLIESGVAITLEEKADLLAAYGLDKPLYQQYFFWLGDLAILDLGTSIQSNIAVTEILKKRIPNTLILGVLTLMVSYSFSIPVGLIAALKADKIQDYAARSFAVLGLALPSFWLALIVIVFPAHYLGWVPPLKFVPFSESPWDHLKIFIAPALVGGAFGSASVMRMTRSMLLEVLRTDYIRTARAKGLRERIVISRHAMKNTLIPLVTIMGSQVAFLLSGTVIMEIIFGVPGVGALMRDAIIGKDYPVVQSVTVVLASFVLLINLIVDISYGWLNPRIRYA